MSIALVGYMKGVNGLDGLVVIHVHHSSAYGESGCLSPVPGTQLG